MTSKREKLKSDVFKAKVESLLNDGLSISAIAKKLGKSYRHTRNIACMIKYNEIIEH